MYDNGYTPLVLSLVYKERMLRKTFRKNGRTDNIAVKIERAMKFLALCQQVSSRVTDPQGREFIRETIGFWSAFVHSLGEPYPFFQLDSVNLKEPKSSFAVAIIEEIISQAKMDFYWKRECTDSILRAASISRRPEDQQMKITFTNICTLKPIAVDGY